jgi:hypothetical protein
MKADSPFKLLASPAFSNGAKTSEVKKLDLDIPPYLIGEMNNKLIGMLNVDYSLLQIPSSLPAPG